MNILAVNSGSSSLKAKVFQIKKNKVKTLFSFHIEEKNIEKAIKILLEKIQNQIIDGIGQRVVHGGEKYQKPTIITKTVTKEIAKLSKLAPLHNPINLKCIETFAKLMPKVKQVAIFDTAFHQSLPEKAYLYALPHQLYKKEKIRRYGFHGTSHQYVTEQALKLMRTKKAKIISCHLGNGSSITASINGKSIDTSMGLSPLEGIPMGTRSGSIDPTIVLELAKKIGIEPTNIMLNKQSGLKALSQISSDMREIYQKSLKKDPKALLTIEILAYQIAKYCGAYAAAMNGLDALIFTGGLGEKAWYIREQTAKYFQFLNLKLDSKANKNNQETISSKDSNIKVFVIETEEEKQIAIQTASIL